MIFISVKSKGALTAGCTHRAYAWSKSIHGSDVLTGMDIYGLGPFMGRMY